jgi:hypothetical protein
MPITLEIRENGHILYYVYTDPWQIIDMNTTIKIAEAHYNRVNFKVHSIINLSGSRQVPQGLIHARRSVSTLKHPNNGNAIIFGASNLIKTLGDVLIKLVRYDRVNFFDTEEQAWTHARKLIGGEK